MQEMMPEFMGTKYYNPRTGKIKKNSPDWVKEGYAEWQKTKEKWAKDNEKKQMKSNREAGGQLNEQTEERNKEDRK